MDTDIASGCPLCKSVLMLQSSFLVNRELLGLYYAVEKYVSENSRNSVWGQDAIKQLSESLQQELPGLRGFSEVSIKRMRLFYEGW